MAEPLVSVIMPAYNAEKTLERAVNSILGQTYTNLELLIVDDCSSDSTYRMAEGFLKDKRVKLLKNENNLGYLESSNLLFKETKGDFITFMDADDWSSPERIRKFLQAFEKDPELACLGSDVIKTSYEGEPVEKMRFPNTDAEIKAQLPRKIPCVGSALMLRRKVLQEMGAYHPFFNRLGSEDLYWFGKIALKYKVASLPEFLYFYRGNPASVSNNHRALRARISEDLARFLLEQNIKQGSDGLSNPQLQKEFDLYVLKKEAKLHLWDRDYKTGLQKMLKVFFKSPFQSKEFYSDLLILLKGSLKTKAVAR
jgi:glycosyltransferase involved in cell wall biosynthesis